MGCPSGHVRKGLIDFIGSLSDGQKKSTYVNISEQRNKQTSFTTHRNEVGNHGNAIFLLEGEDPVIKHTESQH